MSREVSNDFNFENLKNLAGSDAAGRYSASAIIMEKYGDTEMAETLKLLSAQMDFANEDEASDAINRTQTKLNDLIKARKQRHASGYIKMIQDSDVESMSSGVVTEPYGFDPFTSSYNKNGLFDPDIFGGEGKIPVMETADSDMPYDMFGNAMGHIELPVHVVRPDDFIIVSCLLSMTTENVESVVGFSRYVVIRSSEPDLYKVGQVLTEKEYQEIMAANIDGLEIGMGGDAIYKMLCDLNYPDHPERLAFTKIPVIAPKYRPMAYVKDQDKYTSADLNDAYKDVLVKSNRVRKFISMGVPSIILRNESRILQDTVTQFEKMVSAALSEYAPRIRHCRRIPVGLLNQLFFAHRHNLLTLPKPVDAKRSEIESLHIYPETVLEMKDGIKTEISFTEVLESCNDSICDYTSNNTIMCPADEELSEEDQKLADEIAAHHDMMEDILDQVEAGAKEQREKFIVVYDAELGMYKPFAEIA